MAMFCNKSQDKIVTIIPDRETSSGFTHFYKDGADWKFIAEEDYESKKGDIPDLAFAVAYPFSQFETKALSLPDLAEALRDIGKEEEAKIHGATSTYS